MPLRVIISITAPELRPYSGRKLLVITRNSWVASGFREVTPPGIPGTSASLLSIPSKRKLLLRSLAVHGKSATRRCCFGSRREKAARAGRDLGSQAGDQRSFASVPSRKYVHIVAGLWRRSSPPWQSRRTAARGCWNLARIDRFSSPVPSRCETFRDEWPVA